MDMEMDSMYFCGNSLGLQPKESRTLVIQELDKWQKMYIIIFVFQLKFYLLHDLAQMKEPSVRLISAVI